MNPEIHIVIKFNAEANKIATGMRVVGFRKDNAIDRLAILGAIENSKKLVEADLKKLCEYEK